MFQIWTSDPVWWNKLNKPVDGRTYNSLHIVTRFRCNHCVKTTQFKFAVELFSTTFAVILWNFFSMGTYDNQRECKCLTCNQKQTRSQFSLIRLMEKTKTDQSTWRQFEGRGGVYSEKDFWKRYYRDLDLWPFDLVFIVERGIVMDYPCAKFGDCTFSSFVFLSCRQTDRQITDRQKFTHRRGWSPYSRYYRWCE